VGRVELDHGDGTVTIARLNEGTFAVATAAAHIAAGLVAAAPVNAASRTGWLR
jgi:hypothetical protein